MRDGATLCVYFVVYFIADLINTETTPCFWSFLLQLYTKWHYFHRKLKEHYYHSLILILTHLFLYPEMMNLDVFNIEFLEITELSVSHKLAPAVRSILCRILFIDQLFQRLDYGVVCWLKEVGNRKPFLLWVHHHPVFCTLISLIAPNLHNIFILIWIIKLAERILSFMNLINLV